MNALENYYDLCTELKRIELDIERVDSDMDFWFGKTDLMLGSLGANKFGSKEAIERIEYFHNKKHSLLKRLEHYQEMKSDYEKALGELTNLEKKIAVMRVVKNMTLKEIAMNLKYSESHIRKLSIRVNKMIHTPLTHDVLLFK